MNIKDILVVGAFALLTMWALDRFVWSRFASQGPSEQVAGSMFSAPTSSKAIKPLRYEVDFTDIKRAAARATVTEIETDWATLTFSSDGAALDRLQFKRHAYGIEENIITVFPAVERDRKAFLTALDEQTPYYFNLIDKQESENSITLTYEGSFGEGILRKKFTVHKKMLKIDVTNELHMKDATKKSSLRIFIPSPVMPNVRNDQISGIFINASGSIEKLAHAKISQSSGWWAPSIFGTENRYFIHAMIASENSCVERAYFNAFPENQIVAVLETRELSSTESCTVTCYMGPKDEQAVAPIDVRLEETFEHSGILAPLSRLLLKLLNMIYRYIHNYGWAIIILTILMRLLLMPFAIRAERSMKKSAEVAERMEYVKRKYKHDPERLRLEQAELIKKYGVPGFSGLLPMLAQIPIFIALSRVLSNSIELYRAPFFGWIQDLSAPDPYYILPACIALSMFVNALSLDASKRTSMLIFAIIIGAFSVNFASGLVLYIMASTLFGVIQAYLQKKLGYA